MASIFSKLIFRNLWRNKVFSAINIFGLSIGLASCLLILLYVQHELSYDRYNDKAERMVRVLFRGTVQGEKMNEATVMPPVAQTLKADYPEVEDATRLRDIGSPNVIIGEKVFRDSKAAYADANFFQVFDIPLRQGNIPSVLNEPNMAVISTSMAEKYFGAADAVGKLLLLEGLATPFTVTGVMENMPENSHFHFDVLLAMAGLAEAQEATWMNSNFFTYLVLAKGQDYKQLEAKLPQTIEKYLGPQMEPAMGLSFAEFKRQGNDLGLFLQPLTDIHLSTEIVNPLAPGGNIQYVYMFSAIALFMLLIACINFMNLSTAGASKRAKEIGIRKVMGSSKGHLAWHFMGESLLLTGIALLIAVILLLLVLPVFNTFLGVKLALNPLEQPWLLPGLLGVGLLTGIVAGAYPSFALSSFQVVQVLKGKMNLQERKFGLRSGLVVFQFCISVILIVNTIVVYRQLSYIQNKQLGYNKEQVLVLPNMGPLGQKARVFQQQLVQDTRVRSISISGYLPAGDSYDNNYFASSENNPTQMKKILRYEVDEQYIPTMGMEILAGRNFNAALGDSMAMILNETAAKAFGLEGKEAIGKTITRAFRDDQTVVHQVIGIVKDFHFRSLHEPISPLVMVLGNNGGNVIVKAATADLSGLLASTKSHWDELTANQPFVYSFLDERFKKTYQAEQKTGLMLGLFSLLTIFVACLGLFGLAIFSTERRTKEIGVRKVLGASVAGITGLLARDFLKLVLIAIVIATPLAWYFMQRWLSDFAYRIDMSWWMFALAGAVAVGIAFLTVGFQSVRAALADPVKSLRSE